LSSRRRHTRFSRDWSSDVCSSDLSDYYDSDNEGHIFCKMTNDSNEGKTVTIEEGMGFMQGIFIAYGITFDDEVNEIRNGGLGSRSEERRVGKERSWRWQRQSAEAG